MLVEHGASDPSGQGADCAEAWQREVAATIAAATAPPEPVVTYRKAIMKRPPLVIPEHSGRMALFDAMDVNGNQQLSFNEVHRCIADAFPGYNHKPALMRAYKAADKDNDSRIERREFGTLLRLLVYFNEVWDVFDSLDRDDDHRLGPSEFEAGCRAVGLRLTAAEALAEFRRADKNGGGFVLFEEFIGWCAKRSVILDDWEQQQEEQEEEEEGGGRRV